MEQSREQRYRNYTRIRQLFFVIPVTIFTIVLFFIHTGVGILCFAILFVTTQLTTFITFHQRASHWRDSVDGVIKEVFVFLFKVGLKKKATKSQGLCQKEATKISRLIVKDFVKHWYNEFSDDKEFPNDVLLLLEHLAIKLEDRCRTINVEDLLAEIIPLLTVQLKAVSSSAAVEDTGGKKYDVQSSDCTRQFVSNHPEAVHGCLINYNSEYRHIKNIIDLLFDTFLPVKYKHCEGGRLFVREVLTCRVVLPTINEICNSNFLNRTIVHLLSPSDPNQVGAIMRKIETENAELDAMQSSHRHHYASYMIRTRHRHYQGGDNARRGHGLGDEASHSWREMSFEEETVYQSPISIVGFKRVQNGGFVGYVVQFPLEVVEGDGGYLRISSTRSTPMAHALIRYSRFEKLHATLNRPPLSKFLQGVKLPEKKSLSNLLHKVTLWTDNPEFLQERKKGLEAYLKSLWRVNEIRSSGLLRQFLAEGMELYKTHCTTQDEYGEEATSENQVLSTSEEASVVTSQQSEAVKPKKAVQKMLNNYLYVHLPLNTTTLPVLSLNAADTASEEATSVQPSNKQQQQPVSMVTALADAGRLPKTRSRSSTGSEDGPAFSSVMASSDRRHFWTDNVSEMSVDSDVGADLTNDNDPVEKSSHQLSSSTAASPTFLSSTPPLSNGMFDSRGNSPLASSTTSDHEVFITPPTTPANIHPTPVATPTPVTTPTSVATPALLKPVAESSKKRKVGGLRYCIKNLVSKLYKFLMILFKASFVPVSDRMLTLLAKEQETRSPLSNALLCFVTEVTSKTMNKPWLCNERLQLGMLSLFGKQLDRYILDLLLTVTEDEVQWCRAMFYLRNMFWPGGQFDMSPRRQLSEQESIKLKQQATEVIKLFFPVMFSHMLGKEEYNESIKLCLTCLENPELNRHLIYKILDVVVAKVVPEIKQAEFTNQLLCHRTRLINS